MEANKRSAEKCTCGAGVAVAVVSRADCAGVTSCCTTAEPGVTASDETAATCRKQMSETCLNSVAIRMQKS